MVGVRAGALFFNRMVIGHHIKCQLSSLTVPCVKDRFVDDGGPFAS